MCGFASIISLAGSFPPGNFLDRMLASIVHRGPDDEGRVVDGSVAFGFRRLSILDLSPLGHQPMDSEDGSCTIVFNGEIYNFVELREQLRELGHRFRSSGDTEVLLAAYRQWGSACLARLNGMWAFLILDRTRGVVFGARDRFGIKPLYRWSDGRFLIFASEIKAIRASGLYRDELNRRTCAAFLHQSRLDDTNETFYAGITQIPAAHAFELRLDGTFKQWCFWDIESRESAPKGHAPTSFAELFEDAMRIHMRSDVPVGVNLSGGLDSTSILCAAARLREAAHTDERLLAFCYFDPTFSETPYVEATLAQTGVQLVPLELTPIQLWDSLPEVLRYQDEPVHAMSAVIGFHLMRLAKESGVKVILNGQGADEVMAGYTSYFHERWCDLIRSGRFMEAWREVEAYADSQGGPVAQRLYGAALRVAKTPLHHLGVARSMYARVRQTDVLRRDWIHPDLAGDLEDAGPPPVPGLRAALLRSVARAPLPLYLRVEDRNSMAHSVEVRLPFLDHRLVSLVSSLDDSWKIRGPWNKYVLREGMQGRIPEMVRTRVDKMGFPTSTSKWLRATLYERVREVMYSRELKDLGFFDVSVLRQRLEMHRHGQGDYSGALLAATQLCLWRTAVA